MGRSGEHGTLEKNGCMLQWDAYFESASVHMSISKHLDWLTRAGPTMATSTTCHDAMTSNGIDTLPDKSSRIYVRDCTFRKFQAGSSVQHILLAAVKQCMASSSSPTSWPFLAPILLEEVYR
jgi:hypothetical protein